MAIQLFTWHLSLTKAGNGNEIRKNFFPAEDVAGASPRPESGRACGLGLGPKRGTLTSPGISTSAKLVVPRCAAQVLF